MFYRWGTIEFFLGFLFPTQLSAFPQSLHLSLFHCPISRIRLLRARAAVGQGVISTVLEWPPLTGSMGGERPYVPSCFSNADADNSTMLCAWHHPQICDLFPGTVSSVSGKILEPKGRKFCFHSIRLWWPRESAFYLLKRRGSFLPPLLQGAWI